MNQSEKRATKEPVETPGGKPWRWARRILLGLAAIVTLIAAIHTVENWRGNRVWEQCKRALIAKGEVIDWAAFIPPPIPAEQNVYKAEKMAEWFVRDSRAVFRPTNQADTVARPFQQHAGQLQTVYSGGSREPIVLASVQVKLPIDSAPEERADAVLSLNDTNVTPKAAALVNRIAGGMAPKASSGWFVAEWPIRPKPLNVLVRADERPTLDQLNTVLLPSHLPLSRAFQLVADGATSFRIQLGNQNVYLAAEYLTWTSPDTNDLVLIRTALERPRASIGGSYEAPFARPIPNFVSVRTVAQRLAERAECHILLGNPDAALNELTTLHKMSKLLEAEPTTLVAAMIDVAVTGLYSDTVNDGLRRGAWREPQLLELQRQCGEIRLIQKVVHALRTERAGVSRTLEVSSRDKFFALSHGRGERTTLEKVRDSAGSALFPKGWVHQNRAFLACYEQEVLECFDPTNQVVLKPGQLSRLVSGLEHRLGHFSPYTILARIAVPNTSKAASVAARNQALARCTLAACALERYRAEHSGYPEKLGALVPKYLGQIPEDPMTGKALRFGRIGDGIVLYSVGWNQQDDGGLPGEEIVEGDWVW